MAELIPATLQSISLAGTFNRVNSQILQAATNLASRNDLTDKEIDVVLARVVVIHGIKTLPSTEVADLCLNAWETKYKFSMNKDELVLAFELNVKGDFKIKSGSEVLHSINHYQCLSVEFFCAVLNQYLSERDEAIKKLNAARKAEEDKQRKPAVDTTVKEMESIIGDYQRYHEGGYVYFSPENQFHPSIDFLLSTKLDTLSEMFDVDLSEDNISKQRERARRIILRNLNRDKRDRTGMGISYKKNVNSEDGDAQDNAPIESDPDRKPNAMLAIANQYVRIKEGKLITEGDEALIQQQVRRLLYLQVIDKYLLKEGDTLESNEFVNHIRENILLYQQNKQS